MSLSRLIVIAVLSPSLVGLCAYRILAKRYTTPQRGTDSAFHLPSGKRIYVEAKDNWADNWTDQDDDESEHIVEDRRAERLVQEEFKKRNVALAENEEEADFTFLLVIAPGHRTEGIVAELDTRECISGSAGCESLWHAFGDSPAQMVELFSRDVLQ